MKITQYISNVCNIILIKYALNELHFFNMVGNFSDIFYKKYGFIGLFTLVKKILKNIYKNIIYSERINIILKTKHLNIQDHLCL